jgi:hypothetical protein
MGTRLGCGFWHLLRSQKVGNLFRRHAQKRAHRLSLEVLRKIEPTPGPGEKRLRMILM